MEPHDLLTISATKGAEYLVAVVSLPLFVGFWRYLHHPTGLRDARAAPAEADAPHERAAAG